MNAIGMGRAGQGRKGGGCDGSAGMAEAGRPAAQAVKIHAAWLAAAVSVLLWAAPAAAQICEEPKTTDFKKTVLLNAGMDRPVHIAVVPDGRVFIGEMPTGKILVYKPGATAPVTAGTVPTKFDNEDGLLGIAAPPDFAATKFLYVLHTDTSRNTVRYHVITRVKVEGDNLDMSTRTEILRFRRVDGGRYHAAGGMVFDEKGDLWFSTGDDTDPHDKPNDGFAPIYHKEPGKDAQKSAANTNDLRGKINRIHPVAAQVDGKWYTVPAGNFKDEYSSFWSAADLAKVRPEIYAMGTRNAFRFSVDSRRGWLIWGEVGPDAISDLATRGRMGYDELNVAAKPGFYGWPYCNGNQFAYNDVDYSGATGVPGAKFDCALPVNNSPNNTGVNKLPPSQAPILWYARNNRTDFPVMGQGDETAMAGPVYKYDSTLASAVKFPPQYDGRLLFWDWSRTVHKLVTLTKEGKLDKVLDFPVTGLGSNVSAQYGPDGALYILQYSTFGYADIKSALIRIEYTGPRDAACIPSAVSRNAIRKADGSEKLMILAGNTYVDLAPGRNGFIAFDMSGKQVWTYVRAGDQGMLRVNLPAAISGGLLRIRFI